MQQRHERLNELMGMWSRQPEMFVQNLTETMTLLQAVDHLGKHFVDLQKVMDDNTKKLKVKLRIMQTVLTFPDIIRTEFEAYKEFRNQLREKVQSSLDDDETKKEEIESYDEKTKKIYDLFISAVREVRALY